MIKEIGTFILRSLAITALGITVAIANPLIETTDVQYTSVAATDLRLKAAQLATPTAIYEYLRNDYEYTLYHGSRSGSINTFLSGRGNDVDLASTLIAMLRSINVPARYATGTVRVDANQVANWLGVHNVDLAYAILRDQGIQNVVLAVDKSTIDFEHVWVEALVGYSPYRGAGPDAQTSTTVCATTPVACHWIALDPSFKQRRFHNQGIDIYGQVAFDYTAYYNAIKNQDATRMDKNPLAIYEEQILDYLKINHPGKTLEDVVDAGTIVREEAGILPASLPYQIIGGAVSYDNVSDHDAVASKVWTKYANVSLQFACFSTGAPPIPLVELATKRFTLTYELGTPERLVFRLDGNDYSVPLTAGSFICNGQTVGLNYPFSMTIKLDGAPAVDGGVDSTIDVTYDNLIIGGYYLIGTGGDSSNWSQVHRAANELLAANDQYPIVNDIAGVPYVDSNGNGLIDVGEPRLLDNYPAQDALTGGLLYTSMNLYFARFHDAIRRLDGLNHVISPIEGFVGVVSSTYEVEYLDGTAFSVMPGGLLIDMKGQKFNGAWRDSALGVFANEHFKLVGHAMSSLEHEIWQEITGYDAVSTVRGIQMALANGASLVDAKKNATVNTLPAFFTALGFTTQAPAPYVSNVRTIFANQLASWSHPQNVQTLHLAKSAVDSSMLTTPPFRATRWAYPYNSANSGAEGWGSCVDTQENQLKAWIAQGFGNYNFNPPGYTFCDGSVRNVTVSQTLAQLSTFWTNTVIPTNIGLSMSMQI